MAIKARSKLLRNRTPPFQSHKVPLYEAEYIFLSLRTKIPPYEAKLIFQDIKMGFRERSKNYRNCTPLFVSKKIPPYEAELIFLDLKMGFRERSKNYRNRTPLFLSHKIPPYEAELIFLDLKMGFRKRSKNYRNRTPPFLSHKIPPTKRNLFPGISARGWGAEGWILMPIFPKVRCACSVRAFGPNLAAGSKNARMPWRISEA